MSRDVLLLITFQSFFLINNIGRNILDEHEDEEELQFFFKMYQFIIFDLMHFLGLRNKKKIDSNENIELLSSEEMFVLYNYMIDFISEKKGEYNNLDLRRFVF